mmetsp:Transcript_20625/g.24807  ORF Transcript_20625/g.24807 Transcript_20625/m.24807 type:complete len:132 (-) Transcript_20625:16-411(-)
MGFSFFRQEEEIVIDSTESLDETYQHASQDASPSLPSLVAVSAVVLVLVFPVVTVVPVVSAMLFSGNMASIRPPSAAFRVEALRLDTVFRIRCILRVSRLDSSEYLARTKNIFDTLGSCWVVFLFQGWYLR